MALAKSVVTVVAALVAGSAWAQQTPMPEDLAWKLLEIGRVIDVPRTAALYAPMQPQEPYAGVKTEREVKYGPADRHLLDVFTPEANSTARPVLIYIHGGGFVAGNKRTPGSPFYDNIMLWAVKSGFVGVNATYRLAPQSPWPAGPEDLAAVVQWVSSKIAERGGDPARIYLMGQSAGASHVAQYIAHRQFHPEGGHGLAAGLLISGIFEPNNQAYFGDDQSKWPSQSALPGLIDSKLPLLVTVAENDPPNFEQQALKLVDGLAKRDNRFPWFQRMWGHNHISAMLHVGLQPEDQLGDLILDFVATHGS